MRQSNQSRLLNSEKKARNFGISRAESSIMDYQIKRIQSRNGRVRQSMEIPKKSKIKLKATDFG